MTTSHDLFDYQADMLKTVGKTIAEWRQDFAYTEILFTDGSKLRMYATIHEDIGAEFCEAVDDGPR